MQWNHEADLYLKNVPKILVGCKKDINRGGSQTVWTRDVGCLLLDVTEGRLIDTSRHTSLRLG